MFAWLDHGTEIFEAKKMIFVVKISIVRLFVHANEGNVGFNSFLFLFSTFRQQRKGKPSML